MTISKIHPLAVVHQGAQLDESVEVGPFSIIGEHVRVGAGTTIGSNVIIDGWTTIGCNCRIFHGAVLGTEPQDLKYKGEKSYVKIGDNNLIREFVTVHRATSDEGVTQIGDNNFLMAYVHIGHNCIIGSNTLIANATSLAGHVDVEDRAVIGGMSGVHQFVRVGSLAMVGGYARVVKDVPPYSMVWGQPARLFGLNIVGLKRQKISQEVRGNLKRAYRIIAQKSRLLALEEIKTQIAPGPEIAHLIKFLESPSKMGIILRRVNDSEASSSMNLTAP
ncbi:MAG: acyl-ACP--UDP-N-acetylglucosamine O-acyltransferase [Candidatus Eremiobacteraeota bacterium]|nr:acyl-ACP--UDP-N-acetylglucosamine O-acyltransferase [Candidatus Eremiobacteraeota bacterium]